jgi:aminoglycoside phosphotransferase family enzyme/predicted kinase
VVERCARQLAERDGSPPDIVETHISIVLLGQQDAYKFKKSVDFGFVDYSTLEERKRFCELEVRLNRRTAPELYHGTIAITGTRQAPVLNGSGQAVEYAVHMRRFPEHAQLDYVLERGELGSELIDDVAQAIGSFHLDAAVSPPSSPFASKEMILQQWLDTLSHIAPAEPELRDCCRRLHDWFAATADRLEPEFRRRKDDGYVRECHGDLHLTNMVLLDGRVRLFDCIEFSENLRWIDVISDLGFILMDLELRGRAELSGRLLNGYLEHTGDYSGLALLRAYQAYRSTVRAKVAQLQLESATPCDQAEIAERMRAHLLLAESYTRASPLRLIITHGLSGSGKTWLSSDLLARRNVVRIRSDVERKRMHGIDREASVRAGPGRDLYDRRHRDRVYDHLERLAAGLLEAGWSVIVDATFLAARHRRQFRTLARKHAADFLILEVSASNETLRRRLMRRTAAKTGASDATVEVLDYQQTELEPLTAEETAAAIHVDTDTADAREQMLSLIPV